MRVTPRAGGGGSLRHVNPLNASLASVRRVMNRAVAPTCFVCRRRILDQDERLRLRHDTLVHRSCATYRMRNRRPASRLGYPG